MLAAAWIVHFAHPICYSLAVKRIKTEQRRSISNTGKESFFQLAIPTAEFDRLFNAEENEISLDGSMYDVASIEKSADTVYCSVVYDKKETDMQDRFAKSRQQQHSLKNNKPIAYFWPYRSDHTKVVCPNLFVSAPLYYTIFGISKVLAGYTYFMPQPPDEAFI